MPFDLSTARKVSQPVNNVTGLSHAAKVGIDTQADITKAAPIELQKAGAEKLAEYASNNQRLVDIIRNADEGLALLKPEFADKKHPNIPTKFGTHLGGGFAPMREVYQNYIANDPTISALQGVSAKAQLGEAKSTKLPGSVSDFEQRLYGLSAKVDPFRYDEAQNYQALNNQKVKALELQKALFNEANFNPKANLLPNNIEQKPYNSSGNNEIELLVNQYTKPMVKP